MKTAICSNVDGPSDYHIVVVWSLSHAQLFVNPCSPPRSSVPGISQARIPEQIAISFSKGSSQPRDQIRVSCLADEFFMTETIIILSEVIQTEKDKYMISLICRIFFNDTNELIY